MVEEAAQPGAAGVAGGDVFGGTMSDDVVEIGNTKYFEKMTYPWIAYGYELHPNQDGTYTFVPYRQMIYPDGRIVHLNPNEN